VWYADPGINPRFDPKRPDGTAVPKFDAPKATLMSYIIKGILDRKLPWALVLLGVMIAVTRMTKILDIDYRNRRALDLAGGVRPKESRTRRENPSGTNGSG